MGNASITAKSKVGHRWYHILQQHAGTAQLVALQAYLSRRSKEATKTLRVKGHKRVEKRSAGRRELAIGSSLQEAMPLTNGSKEKCSVLFVCLGNICRSPTAEAVFRKVVEEAGEQDRFFIDSCGTGGGNPDWYKSWSYHTGDPSDRRMIAAATKRGVNLTSRSRPLTAEDMQNFDYILGMDFENIAAIQVAADHWASKGKNIPKDYRSKVQLMCKYLDKEGAFKGITEVPDPYYGGAKGFELVLDLLDDACKGLLTHITEHDVARTAAL
ncbi:hypothetical protein WJX75_002293 [Coccomyxa subellipsoidea]|uniref:Phosphotyrosine protein phosphatase I domain-containing protein n=1 Tax=Coccomyxa subellipsoidea TaxID=248742 RepID=A0ABR2YEN5_9CHLO